MKRQLRLLGVAILAVVTTGCVVSETRPVEQQTTARELLTARDSQLDFMRELYRYVEYFEDESDIESKPIDLHDIESWRALALHVYELALDRLDVAPHEAVFIDDFRRNIKGAKAVGMHAIHFQKPDQAIMELEHILKGS